MSYGYLSRTPRDIKRQLGKRLSVEEEIGACAIGVGDVIWMGGLQWGPTWPYEPSRQRPPPSRLGIVRDIRTESRCVFDSGVGTSSRILSCGIIVRFNPIERFGLLPSDEETEAILSFKRDGGSFIFDGRERPVRIVRLYRGGSIPYEDVFGR